MNYLRQAGAFIFGTALAEFGLQYCFSATSSAVPVTGPPWPPVAQLWAVIVGLFLLACGVAIALRKTSAQAAACLSILLILYVVIYFIPKMIANPRNPGPWTSSGEILAICSAALVAAVSIGLERTRDAAPRHRLLLARNIGCVLFGASLVVFGIQHLMYGPFVATLIPAWIPARLFWAYFVGAAFVAAALAISTNIQARLAAILLGTMFLLWFLILHLPRVFAAPHNGNEWTSAFVALAMSGAAFLLAANVTDRMSTGRSGVSASV
jgi:uncharacterized membrane protein YphA (DoxX/SURF4 family)